MASSRRFSDSSSGWTEIHMIGPDRPPMERSEMEQEMKKQAHEIADKLPEARAHPSYYQESNFRPINGLTISPPNSVGEDEDGDNEHHELGIDSDTDEEEDPGDEVIKTKNNRLAKAQQKAIFEKYCNKRASDELKNPKKQKEEPENNELSSTKYLLTNTTTAIISDPREYQLELFEKAKQQNTIAVLDTGSGKTLIATLLARWVLDQELEERANGRPPKICVFLVNSVTLVFQQAAVMECNLDAQVGRYHGDMGTDMWKREQWEAKMQSDQIFVATADVIFNCLTHSFLKMSDFSLMIFDECHHTKKQHAYARIMREFYEPEVEENRPRIFGMTASPVDARVDVVKAAQQLERLLHSRICTTSDPALMRKFFTKPEEMTLEYMGLKNPSLTPLNNKLAPFAKAKGLEKIYAFVKDVAIRDLGPWCADHIWQISLTELESARQERRAGARAGMGQQPGLIESADNLDQEVLAIKAARAIVEAHHFEHPKLTLESFSPKLYILLQFLVNAFTEHPDYKCIIFVKRRHTAQCIEAIFKNIFQSHGMEHRIRVGTLVGSSGQLGTDSMTFRAQTLALHRFRRGYLNCLIATAVAEEGLDVPDCNLVIRFDLYGTMIQYIQSRGRARHSSSTYIHMVEQDNWEHKQVVQDGQEAERIMKEFCKKLPQDRLLDKQAPPESLGPDPTDGLSYMVAETGAKLTLNSSIQILNQFVDHLGTEKGMSSERAIYIVETIPKGGYRCEIKMPSLAPFSSIEGTSGRSKVRAKQLAAFEACKELHRRKFLDDYLMPEPKTRHRPDMANAHLALDSHKTNSYPSLIKPSFWDSKVPPVPTQLWATCLTLRNPKELEKHSQGICLLTRERPPSFPSFPLYFDRGGQSLVDCVTMDTPIFCNNGVLDKFNKFTFRFFVDIFNKEFEIQTESLPYWILPLKLNKTVTSASSIGDMIDWELLDHVYKYDEQEFDIATTPPEFYLGKFVIDRRQGSRRYYILKHEPKYHPYDPIPEGACNAPHTVNIIDYSYSAGKKGWQRWVGELPPNQPVLRADRVLHRLNFLDRPTEREMTQNTLAYVVPSPFRISPLPAKFCTMGLLFPAISARIDSYLHANDVCKILGVPMDLDLALEAITKDSDNTSDHGEPQQNKRRGMANNYERLEFLGDCFLKLGVTIALFSSHPDDDEFSYHVDRMKLVCNWNLFQRAKTFELYKYIQTEGFSRRLWYPMITLIKGKAVGKAESQRTHHLSDKSVADVCEALIGAALCNGGLNKAACMVTALLDDNQHRVSSFKDYYRLYNLPEYQIAPSTASQRELVGHIKKSMGYEFRYPRLLRSAFTHPSFPSSYERIPCYERLEFLGDALIDMACVEDLWERFPGKDPQWLTEHKMSMINNRFQGALCVKLGLHRHLRAMGAHINALVQEYVQLITEAETVSNGSVDYWIDVKQPPKVLPDILEAYVGALFVDSHFDYNVVTDFFRTHIRPFFLDMSIFDSFAGNHPVTHLSTRMTELGCTDWRILSKEHRDRDNSYILSCVMFHTSILAEGKAASQKNARTNAAKHALVKLDKMSTAEFLKTCTCAELRKMEAQVRNEEKEGRKREKNALREQGGMVDAMVL
ncbi:Dicer-like protein 1 [Orbilia ellipsospora]|uniref:Dicer-like protein 1 n=1 Tax=Orbilia ellipsospora TaxID=2528407 RepID=A0AAV9X1J1_9PEZI